MLRGVRARIGTAPLKPKNGLNGPPVRNRAAFRAFLVCCCRRAGRPGGTERRVPSRGRATLTFDSNRLTDLSKVSYPRSLLLDLEDDAAAGPREVSGALRGIAAGLRGADQAAIGA
jgi:hypothetical protein